MATERVKDGDEEIKLESIFADDEEEDEDTGTYNEADTDEEKDDEDENESEECAEDSGIITVSGCDSVTSKEKLRPKGPEEESEKEGDA